MFKSLQEFFNSKTASSSKSNAPSERDLQLAAATLMFELIRADGKVDDEELQAMGEALHQQFKLNEKDINQMIALARESAYEATSLQGFTREICNNWGNAKRYKLLEHLWQLALTDQHIDAHERHFVRKVAGLLYLTEMQIVQAREKAKMTLGIEDF